MFGETEAAEEGVEYSDRNRDIVVFGIEEVSILERKAVRLGESSVGKNEYEYIRLDDNKVSISYEDGQVLYGLGMDFTQKANVFLPREGNWYFFFLFFFPFI